MLGYILLNQLNRDFAAPLLAQCYRIAKLNHQTTPVEQNIINAITSKFDIAANTIESVVENQKQNGLGDGETRGLGDKGTRGQGDKAKKTSNS